MRACCLFPGPPLVTVDVRARGDGMGLYLALGDEDAELSSEDVKAALFQALTQLGPRRRVLAVPPDLSRFHSRSGELTRGAFEFYGDALQCVLPALGTHSPMTSAEISQMFGDMPQD